MIPSRADAFNAQFMNDQGVFTMLGSQSCDLQGLPAEEGIQRLQICIMTAAQHTYDQAKSSTYQPKGKPWVDDECSQALQSYQDALQGPSSHLARD